MLPFLLLHLEESFFYPPHANVCSVEILGSHSFEFNFELESELRLETEFDVLSST